MKESIIVEEAGIYIESYRADSASYQKEVIKIVEKQGCYFYIRNIDSAVLRNPCGQVQPMRLGKVLR